MKLFFRDNLKVTEKKNVSFSENTFREKCKKWDRSIASVFALLAFLMLVGIVLYNILSETKNSQKQSNDRKSMVDHRDTKPRCTITKCSVKCDKIYEDKEESFEEEIKIALETNPTCTEIDLKITKSRFLNRELNQGWLENLTVDVTQLELHDCNLTQLNNRAFSGNPFTKMSKLLFIKTKITALTREAFLDAGIVSYFCFQIWEGFHRLTIKENALEGMKDTLTVLEFSRCKFLPQDIINLTGPTGTRLTKLIEIDLKENAIEEIKDRSFSNASKIQKLHLKHSGIGIIQQRAFIGGSNLRILDLSDNALTTLPEGVFNALSSLEEQKLFLSGNDWNCICTLSWLKEYYINTKFVSKNPPPKCFGECSFTETDFCPTNTTIPSTISSHTPSLPSISSTSSHTIPETTAGKPITVRTTITTTIPSSSANTERPIEPSLRIICRPYDKLIPDAYENIFTNEKVEVEIQYKNITLEISEYRDTGPLLVLIKTSQDLSDYNLIWFNADDKSEYGCVANIRQSQPVDGLRRGTTYTFSLLKNGENTASPNSNFCIKTQPEWSLRTWIHNEYQTTIIAGLVCSLLFLICITGYITFLCIRRYPKIISSNKNVIIVKSKQDSQTESPTRQYEGPAYCEPYLVPSSQGYLTPKYHRYSKVRYRPPLMRSLSEWSVGSSNVQCLYDAPRQFQEIRSKLNRNRLNNVEIYDEYRPPLPPPNPGSRNTRTSQETEQESFYS